MRRIICVAVAMAVYVAGLGQDITADNVRHYSGKVKYQKIEHDATVFELPYPKDQVEEGMRKLAGERGAKAREKNGFFEVKNVTIQKLSNKVCDIYYKVERDGKNASKVYMILTEPGEDLASRTSSHTALMAAAGGTAVVAAVGSSLNDHDRDVQIKKQEGEIKEGEAKYKSLQEEQKRLEKKLSEVQNDLEKNKTDQARLQSELESKKSALEVFRKGKKKD